MVAVAIPARSIYNADISMGFVPPFPNLFVQPPGIVGHLLLVVRLLEISGNTVICYSMNRCAKFCGYFQNHFLASYSEVGAESETKHSPCFKPRTDHLCSQLVAFLGTSTFTPETFVINED